VLSHETLYPRRGKVTGEPGADVCEVSTAVVGSTIGRADG
jgi:hypothetical protein